MATCESVSRFFRYLLATVCSPYVTPSLRFRPEKRIKGTSATKPEKNSIYLFYRENHHRSITLKKRSACTLPSNFNNFLAKIASPSICRHFTRLPRHSPFCAYSLCLSLSLSLSFYLRARPVWRASREDFTRETRGEGYGSTRCNDSKLQRVAAVAA